jgi:hypothetical protein
VREKGWACFGSSIRAPHTLHAHKPVSILWIGATSKMVGWVNIPDLFPNKEPSSLYGRDSTIL